MLNCVHRHICTSLQNLNPQKFVNILLLILFLSFHPNFQVKLKKSRAPTCRTRSPVWTLTHCVGTKTWMCLNQGYAVLRFYVLSGCGQTTVPGFFDCLNWKNFTVRNLPMVRDVIGGNFRFFYCSLVYCDIVDFSLALTCLFFLHLHSSSCCNDWVNTLFILAG